VPVAEAATYLVENNGDKVIIGRTKLNESINVLAAIRNQQQSPTAS
jgi:hypothetical protein